jgi:hypothetical protein
VAAGLDPRPGIGLRGRRAGEASLEPRGDGRMKQRMSIPMLETVRLLFGISLKIWALVDLNQSGRF